MEISVETRDMVYNSLELLTLKEAKEKYEHLNYLVWLKDDDLGYVVYSVADFINNFKPVTRKGNQLVEK